MRSVRPEFLIAMFLLIASIAPPEPLAAQTAAQTVEAAAAAAGQGEYAIPTSIPLLGVPVGAVLPFVGSLDSLPPEWLPCDGRVVDDPDSPLHGAALPNLTDDRFLMGVESSYQVRGLGGTNEIAFDGSHGHAGETASQVTLRRGTPRYLVDRGDRGVQHTHKLEMRTDGRHQHGGENRPKFYGVRFIIRVK